MHEHPPELALVVPVYNEQEAIIAVLREWREEFQRHSSNFLILVINDGSSDGTAEKLATLDWPELQVLSHANRGHGQSCLAGYIEAARQGATYTFQIDSDGQCDPASFAKVWEQRRRAPAVYGRRVTRDDGWSRVLISRLLRWNLKLAQHTRLNDANVPFRLYHAQLATETAQRIPRSFDLANIAMALLMEPHGFIEVPIHFRDRTGGHPTVRWWGFARKAVRLRRDFKTLRHAG